MRAFSLQTVRRVVQAPRTRRVITGLLIFLVVFGLLVFFAAPPLIRQIAERQLSNQLDRPATISRIVLNPYTLNLEVDHIHIGERGGAGDFVDIARLIVQPSWTSLFRLAPIINEVQVDSPHFHIIRYDARRFNFTDLIERFAAQPSKPNSKPTLFSVSNIRLESGQITFDDRLLGTTHVIDQWKLGIPFIATLPSKADIFVEPMLRARIDGSPLAIDGKTKPFAASRESEVLLRFDGLDVPRILSYVPGTLPVTVRTGKLSTDLKLNFVMAGEKPSLRVSGTVDLNNVDVLDRKMMPFFAARTLHVAAAKLEPLKNLYYFDDIRIDMPTVKLARDKEGVLSVERTFVPATPAKKATSAAAASPAHVGEEKAAVPLDLRIKKFALNDGTINLQDEAVSRPVDLGLKTIAVSLVDLSTLGRVPARFTLNAAFRDAAGSLGMAGSFGLAAKEAAAKIDLKFASLPLLQPYLDTLTSVQVVNGALSVTASVIAAWAKSPPDVQIGKSEVDLRSVKLAMRGSKEPVVALEHGQVTVEQIDVSSRTAHIAGVDATGLVINAQRLKNGSIDLAALVAPRQLAQQHAAIHAFKRVQEQGPRWHYNIGELTLKDASANFTDNTTPRPVKLSIAPLQLKVERISDDLSRPLPIDLQARFNRKGTLSVTGDVTATPLKLALKVNANGLDAAAFEPYFSSKLNATIASGLLNVNGELAVTNSKALRASYHGDAALVDVRMLDKATSDPFVSWHSLALTNLKASYDELGTDVDAGRVTLSSFYGRVLLDPKGKLSLTNVIAHESGAPQSLTRSKTSTDPVPVTSDAASETAAGSPSAQASMATAPAKAASGAVTAAIPLQSPVKLRFGQLVLQQGRVTYTDNFIKPNYTADLVDIHGTIGEFGTQSTTPAPVDVNAKLAANGPLSIRGMVNPLIAKPALDLTASAKDIELTNLTPYSAKYAGYPITKGKLNVDLHYQLQNDQLTANNHLFIDQLAFGDHIENDTATKLPVRLALSLLKNARGVIDVNIPVFGSLLNPEFSMGGLIGYAILNLLQRAVTAPFSLLANAFGGSGEEMGYVEFEPGSAKLSDAADTKLDTIAKALSDKASIRIDLIGRVDPVADELALRTRYVERLVKQQKIRDLVGNGESIDPSTVTVDPMEYDKYLARAYQAADFRKPRNLVGLTRSVPDDDMKNALAEHAPINDASLRDLAQQRAQSVQRYFEGKIDSSRVFVVAPKLDVQGIKDKGATTRVDFGLGT